MINRVAMMGAILDSKSPSSSQRLVLLALVRCAADDGAWAASLDQLADWTKLSREVVHNALRDLFAGRTIEVADRVDGRFVGLLRDPLGGACSGGAP